MDSRREQLSIGPLSRPNASAMDTHDRIHRIVRSVAKLQTPPAGSVVLFCADMARCTLRSTVGRQHAATGGQELMADRPIASRALVKRGTSYAGRTSARLQYWQRCRTTPKCLGLAEVQFVKWPDLDSSKVVSFAARVAIGHRGATRQIPRRRRLPEGPCCGEVLFLSWT